MEYGLLRVQGPFEDEKDDSQVLINSKDAYDTPTKENVQRDVAEIESGDAAAVVPHVRYDYCVVLRSSEHKSISKLTSKLVASFESMGLEAYVYIPHDRTLVFVLLRPASTDILRKFAEKISYRMKLDPLKLKQYLAERNIEINDDLSVYQYGATEHIFAPYRADIESLFWTTHEYNDDMILTDANPFRTAERIKLIELIILGGVQRDQSLYEYNICRLYRMGHILAYFPMPEHLSLREFGSHLSCGQLATLQAMPPNDLLVEYFGSKINIYFQFVHHIAKWLWFPAIVGTAFQVVIWQRGNDLSFPVTPFFALLMSGWCLLVIKFWKRTENSISLKLNTEDFEETEGNRPEFRGSRTRSFVDGSQFRYFSPKRYMFRRVVGTAVTLGCCAFSVACVAGIYYLQFHLQNTSLFYAAQSICSAINVIVVRTPSLFSTRFRCFAADWHFVADLYSDSSYDELLGEPSNGYKL
jgi:hypothetical protein